MKASLTTEDVLHSRGGGRTPEVLIVDDEPGFRDMLQWYLRARGVNAEVAVDGLDAIRRAERQPFALVITDITMPGLDGLRLLGELKRRNPRTEVILVTGFGTVETAVDAMKKGANDFLLKPYNPESLLARIRTILDEKPQPEREALPC